MYACIRNRTWNKQLHVIASACFSYYKYKQHKFACFKWFCLSLTPLRMYTPLFFTKSKVYYNPRPFTHTWGHSGFRTGYGIVITVIAIQEFAKLSSTNVKTTVFFYTSFDDGNVRFKVQIVFNSMSIIQLENKTSSMTNVLKLLYKYILIAKM